jgi:hypothetical protein
MVLFIGALTSKSYSFVGRKWELEDFSSYNFFDSFGSSIEVFLKDLQVVKILPVNNINIQNNGLFFWLNDKIRFFFDGLFYQQNLIPLIKKKNKFIPINFLDIYNYYFFFKNSLYLKNFELNYFKTFFFFEQFYNLFFLYKLKKLAFCFFFCYFFFDFKNLNKKNYNYLFELSNLNYFNIFFNKNKLYQTPIFYISVFYNFRLENPSFSFFLFKIIKKYNIKLFSFGNQSFFSNNIIINNIGNSLIDFYKFLLYKLNFKIFNKFNNKRLFFFFSSFLLSKSDYFYLFNKYLYLKKFLYSYYNIIYNHLIIYNTLEQYNLLFLFYNLNYKNYLIFDLINLKFLKFMCLELFKLSLFFFFLLPCFFFFFNTFNYVLKKIRNSLFIYHGSHFLNNSFFKLILPISFFFENDNIMLSNFNNFLVSKYIYAPKKKTVIDLVSILSYYEYIFLNNFVFFNLINVFFLNSFLFKFNYLNYYDKFFNNFLFYLNLNKLRIYFFDFFVLNLFLKKIIFFKNKFIYLNFFNYYLTNQIVLFSKVLTLVSYRFYKLEKFYF